jgi:tRNA-dihydrouridine synthase B
MNLTEISNDSQRGSDALASTISSHIATEAAPPVTQQLRRGTEAFLLQQLRANPFVLAPMAGITDSVFRSQMRSLGCGVVITELISAHAIEFKNKKTLDMMRFDEIQHPVGIQLFGEDPEMLGRSAYFAQELGADFIDLNFGCPVTKVVKKGAGSAILRDLPQVSRVFSAVRKAIQIPLTVKIRTGWDESSRNASRVAQLAFDEGLTWVAIHGRTRAAGYSGLADWDYITEVKQKAPLPIIGNGDIHSAEQAVRRLRESGCDAVMIGRGCLKNPWIFQEASILHRRLVEKTLRPPDVSLNRAPLNQEASQDSGHRVAQAPGDLSGQILGHSAGHEIVQASKPASRPAKNIFKDRNFVGLFAEMRDRFLSAGIDERITGLQIKKFAAWYSSGYPGASQFRKSIFQQQNLEEAMRITQSYFEHLQTVEQMDTSGEAFLMGGHG